ncbi:hypothetical protein F5879DRAFT_503818 [Lentinula edodes]|nr:hypothetical protein F5879DRAFT_503818 [Lentinula edodes]
MRLKSLQRTVEDPRFLVQQADIPTRYTITARDSALISNSAPVLNIRQQQHQPEHRPSSNQNGNSRSSVSEVVLPGPSSSSPQSSHNSSHPPHHHHHHQHQLPGQAQCDFHPAQDRVCIKHHAKGVSRSRPELGVPHPVNASAATASSSSYPTSSSSTSPHIIIHAQTSSSAPLSSSSSPALSAPPALHPPPLPPRRSQGMLKPNGKNESGAAEVTDQRQGMRSEELLVAPRTLTTGSRPGPDQAPPSYSELLMEDEFPVDF